MGVNLWATSHRYVSAPAAFHLRASRQTTNDSHAVITNTSRLAHLRTTVPFTVTSQSSKSRIKMRERNQREEHHGDSCEWLAVTSLPYREQLCCQSSSFDRSVTMNSFCKRLVELDRRAVGI